MSRTQHDWKPDDWMLVEAQKRNWKLSSDTTGTPCWEDQDGSWHPIADIWPAKVEAYDEQTRIHPETQCEVFGMQGHGWYTYRDQFEEFADTLFDGYEGIPSINPLFIKLKQPHRSLEDSRHPPGFILTRGD